MRALFLLLFLVVMAVGACAKDHQDVSADEASPVEKGQAFAWVDFKQAIDQAQASNKLILVDIYTDW